MPFCACAQEYVDLFEDALISLSPDQAGASVLVDGDCEAVGVADWSAGQSTLTKALITPHGGTQCLRVTATADANPRKPVATQTILTAGELYLISGWCRADAAGNVPVVFDGAGGIIWAGDDHTTWQHFSFSYLATSTKISFGFAVNAPAGTEYVEFDDMAVQGRADPSEYDGVLQCASYTCGRGDAI